MPKPRPHCSKFGLWKLGPQAHQAFDQFVEVYEAKYHKASQCLLQDRDELLVFYDFPAHHWQSLRTTDPIESAFATIRHRTKRSKGCLNRTSMLCTMFKAGAVCAAKVESIARLSTAGKSHRWNTI